MQKKPNKDALRILAREKEKRSKGIVDRKRNEPEEEYQARKARTLRAWGHTLKLVK